VTTKVVIVRHGQSTYNLEHIIQGRCDKSVLTEKGCEDAQKVGVVLRQLDVATYHSRAL